MPNIIINILLYSLVYLLGNCQYYKLLICIYILTNLIESCSMDNKASRLVIQFLQFEISLRMSTFSFFLHSSAAFSILDSSWESN